MRGRSTLDTAALTGESRAVSVGTGAEAAAGSVNGGGVWELAVVAVGDDTRLARLLAAAAAGVAAKHELVAFADRVAGFFTAVVVLLLNGRRAHDRQLRFRPRPRRLAAPPREAGPREGSAGVSVLYLMIPLALLLAAAALAAFVWSVRGGQLDALDTPPLRILFDDDGETPSRGAGPGREDRRR